MMFIEKLKKPERGIIIGSKKIKIGDKVVIVENNGKIEDDWMLKSFNYEYIVVEKKDQKGNIFEKIIPLTKFIKWTIEREGIKICSKTIRIGDQVTVVRTNGKVEHDWKFEMIEIKSGEYSTKKYLYIVVTKQDPEKGIIKKIITLENLIKWTIEYEGIKLDDNKTIRIGDQVTVVRTNGKVEHDWKFENVAVSEEEIFILVTKIVSESFFPLKKLEKSATLEEFLKWQRMYEKNK